MKTNVTVREFIWETIQPFKWLLIGQFIVAITWAIDLSLRPYIIKIILDKIPTLTSATVWPELKTLIIFYLIMAALIVVIFRFYSWIILKITPRLKKHIGQVLLNHLMDHSHHYYQNQFAGNLANKVNDVMNAVPEVVNTFIDRYFSQLIALIVAMYTVWQVDYKFAIGLFIWVILFMVVSLSFSSKSQALADNAADVRSKITGQIVDILTNMMNIRLFSGKKHEENYYSQSMEVAVKAERKRDIFFMEMQAFQGGSFVLFQALCLWWLVKGLEHQTITTGDFALVLAINISIVDCLWNISKDIQEFAKNIGTLSQGLRLISAAHEIQDKENAKELHIKQGEITFDNVGFHYKGDEPLFSNKSINILPGEKIGLVGFSGSGKSTFVNLILRLFDVTSGRILIDGQDIRDVTKTSLRNAIGMIPQDPSLFHRTLMENIRYGKLDSTDEEVIKASQKAHTHDFIVRLKDGYQSLVGERGIKLSGGQRQRIAIARAFLKNAPILILDEATSQLDSLTEADIQESLWELMENKTTLVVAHRLSTLLHMDRILVFKKGKIVEDGSHNELLAKEHGLYKTLWDAQVGGFLQDEEAEGTDEENNDG